MIMTNKHTIVISPAGVDISGFASPEEAPVEEAPVEAAPVEDGVEEYEEVPAAEEL